MGVVILGTIHQRFIFNQHGHILPKQKGLDPKDSECKIHGDKVDWSQSLLLREDCLIEQAKEKSVRDLNPNSVTDSVKFESFS